MSTSDIIIDNTTQVEVMLDHEEDMFALAVLECGGNPGKAYIQVFGDDQHAGAKGRRMLMRPHVQARISQLNGAIRENALITLESHMIELANIRDMSKNMGAMKVALNAEELRGKAAGFYASKGENVPPAPKGEEHINRLANRLTKMLSVANGQVEDI